MMPLISLRRDSGRVSRLLFLLAALGSCPAWADYLWMKREAGGAVVRAGELSQPKGSLPALVSPKAYLADGKALALETRGDHFHIPSSGSSDLRFSAVGVDEKGSLTYFHAKTGRSETKAASDLELVPTTPGGNTFRLVWKGTPVAASLVNVSTDAGWSRSLRPAKDGTVSLQPLFPGLYLLEVTAKVNGSVSLNGRQYDDVRHSASLTFQVEP